SRRPPYTRMTSADLRGSHGGRAGDGSGVSRRPNCHGRPPARLRAGADRPAAREAVVEVRQEKARSANERIIVQVTVNVNGTFLRAEERAADARVAVD